MNVAKLLGLVAALALLSVPAAEGQIAPGGGGGSVPTGPAGTPNPAVVSVQGVPGGTAVPVSGTFTASLGGFTPSASGARMTALTVTTSDSSVALPTGAVSVVSNVGSNPMYCNVNAVAATTSDELIPANSWFAFTIPSGVTTLHCIATGGSTTANGVGGAGLPTGAGGGSGGGGGGTVAQGTGAAASGAWPFYLVQGTTANAVGNPIFVSPGTGATFAVTGTFYQATQPVSAASLPLPTGAATAALQPTNVAIGSTTSGQTGRLTLGAVTTSAPAYTTGQSNPLSLDTAGNLRVNVVAGGGSGGTSSSFGATYPSTGTAAGAEYLSSPPTLTSGQMVALQTTAAGSLHTTVDNTNANGAAAASSASPVTPSNLAVGGASFAPTQISCGATATQIVAARTGVAGTGRISDTITNTTTTAIYIGGSGVTTSTGSLLPGVVGAARTIKTTAALYCIVATGTATVTNDETY